MSARVKICEAAVSANPVERLQAIETMWILARIGAGGDERLLPRLKAWGSRFVAALCQAHIFAIDRALAPYTTAQPGRIPTNASHRASSLLLRVESRLACLGSAARTHYRRVPSGLRKDRCITQDAALERSWRNRQLSSGLSPS
jgi:hypothetical protein